MGIVQVTEELINQEFEERFEDINDIDITRLLEHIVHIKEIEKK